MLTQEAIKLLKSADLEARGSELETPPQEEFGDMSFPCFILSKEMKRRPDEIAKEIASKIEKSSVVDKIEARGAYVNFFFNWNKLSETVLKNIFKGSKINVGKDKKVMIEFSQPNTAHGLHIGHARATMLGESLARIMKFAGYEVIKANYYGDFGTQMAKSIVAYLKWGRNKVDKKPDLWMWDLYIKFHEEAAKNPEIENEAREILRKLEAKDKRTVEIWKEVRKMVLEGIKETYRRLGVSFDVEFFESEFYNLGRDVANEALRKGFAQESEGAVVTKLGKYGIPDTVLIKSDGTTLYQTRDIGMAVKNFEDYKLHSRIYVVDVRQTLHFRQVFKILELLGYKWANNLRHLGFGFVSLPEGMMASRAGRAVRLDDFLIELRELAYKEVDKHNQEMGEENKIILSDKIGASALVFALLRIEPAQNIVFDKQEVVKFEGYTGPYIQYSHTRCSSILKKAGSWKENFAAGSLKEEEKKLVKMLGMFPEIVQKAALNLRPHFVCSYAYDLATTFSNFYEKCPVLKAETEELRNFRLTLVKASKDVLKNCIELIGMQPVEKM